MKNEGGKASSVNHWIVDLWWSNTGSLNEYLKMHIYANANNSSIYAWIWECVKGEWMKAYTVVHVTVVVKITTFNIFSLYHCTSCIEFSISFCNEIFTVWRHYDVIITSSWHYNRSLWQYFDIIVTSLQPHWFLTLTFGEKVKLHSHFISVFYLHAFFPCIMTCLLVRSAETSSDMG